MTKNPFLISVNDMVRYVEEFHLAAGHPTGASFADTPTVTLSKSMISGEHGEVDEFLVELNQARFEALIGGGVKPETKARLTKELCDAIWVLIDFAITFDLPLEEAFAIVYESNMSKINPETNKPYEVDDTGKVKKGPHFQKAELGVLFV